MGKLRIDSYRKIQDVPLETWNRLAPREAVGLESNHLLANEESRINALSPWYLICYDDDTAVGIIYAFSITLNLAEMAGIYPADVLATVNTWRSGFMETRVLEVGHIASVGRTVCIDPVVLKKFWPLVNAELDRIAAAENAALCFIRDIEQPLWNDFAELEDFAYIPVEGFPLAQLDLPWDSFDGYLGALKSKRRNDLKKRMGKLTANPRIEIRIISDYAWLAEDMARLWTQVAKKNNGYSHEKLTPHWFRMMAKHLSDRSHVLAFFLDGRLVAFGLNLVGDEEFFGMAEGLDYELRDEYALYANCFLESIRIACSLGKKRINLGITTYDFKMSLGAVPQRCRYYMKDCRGGTFTAVYADLFKEVIELPGTSHSPFRQEQAIEVSESPAPNETEQGGKPDPFRHHLQSSRLGRVRLAGMYRYFPVFTGPQGPVVEYENREVIMMGSNSYLGLANHPRVREAMHTALDRYGSGCSGSPLLNGTLDVHRELARQLAVFTGKDDAMLYSTGYQANVGALSALVGRHDVLIMDRRNHASLIDGARLSGAKLVRYEHNNVHSLEQVLARHADEACLIVSDSVFSMEGTIIDLPAMVALKKRYGARLMLDESHAIGVFGKNGRGIAEHYGLGSEVDIIMGTFSKSFASVGGFIAGDAAIIDSLRHNSRGHIFSASLPPTAVAAVLAALKLIESEPWRRDVLKRNAIFLGEGLRSLGYRVDTSESPIVPVFCGHEVIALGAYARLLDLGVYVNPVLSPAVPQGQEVLRVSVMATHEQTHLDRALEAFAFLRTSSWPAPVRPEAKTEPECVPDFRLQEWGNTDDCEELR
ncbi:aminotransferase class I/II-fold pyridoxal phosphate-dependent enzyme [Marispirochaeta sp.]|uniref:aminotransferase class I/II-fold pyridoxal phosphate-dependent enzyme n=1 Tax=Marispirochaeta sp. TaxID=2038653 RepID=UPI0029C6303B|nr:aminotransferase class I/II-fold pyridoxal phosphate-dependent enzyme [Marispirochaeta sp.]